MTRLSLTAADKKDALNELAAVCPNIPEKPPFTRLKIFLYALIKPFTFKNARREIKRRMNILKRIHRFDRDAHGKQN